MIEELVCESLCVSAFFWNYSIIYGEIYCGNEPLVPILRLYM